MRRYREPKLTSILTDGKPFASECVPPNPNAQPLVNRQRRDLVGLVEREDERDAADGFFGLLLERAGRFEARGTGPSG